jgi:DinB family protein
MTMTTADTLDTICARVLTEGYGSGAWHGPDLKAALADVNDDLAFWRPGEGRHNIAEIALHHAFCARGVTAKITGADPGPFVLEGDDWFDAPDASRLSWAAIQDVVAREHKRLTAADADVAGRRAASPLSPAERLDLVLGITCHAVYHAGQVQLIKKLRHG